MGLLCVMCLVYDYAIYSVFLDEFSAIKNDIKILNLNLNSFLSSTVYSNVFWQTEIWKIDENKMNGWLSDKLF